MSTGRPCIIGEFGTEGEGAVDVEAVVNHAKSIGFESVLAWAWNGDGGVMNMVNPAWYDNPTSSTYTENSYFEDVIGML
jgi:mannan endo-1,4-beta-mannosidase